MNDNLLQRNSDLIWGRIVPAICCIGYGLAFGLLAGIAMGLATVTFLCLKPPVG